MVEKISGTDLYGKSEHAMHLVKHLPALAIAAGLLGSLPVCAQSLKASDITPSGLSLTQSRQVLRVVMKHEQYKMASPSLRIDGPWLSDGKPVVRGYFHFGVVYVANTQGHYAVNTSTGDVWDTERCKRYSFPSLSVIQQRISIKTGKKLGSDEHARSELGCP